jgi:hypothetical protein
MTIYALVNLTFVKVTGKIIYPGMTWDSFLSVLLVIIGYPIGIGLWYLLAWCTDKKLNKILRKSGTQRLDLIDEIQQQK